MSQLAREEIADKGREFELMAMPSENELTDVLGYVAAGDGVFMDAPMGMPEKVALPPNSPPADFALYVKGESMQPLIDDGDIVFVQKADLHLPPIEDANLEWQVKYEKVRPFGGRYCIVNLDGEGILKRCDVHPGRHGAYKIAFTSINPARPSRELTRQSDAKIVGVVVSLTRSFKMLPPPKTRR